MKKHLFFICGLTLTLAVGCAPKISVQADHPQSLIFETDMGNDVDDALALDMLYKYVDADKIDLVAVMTNKAKRYSAEYIDLANLWYGHPDIPIGIVQNGVPSDEAVDYTQAVVEMKGDKGEPLFARSIKDATALPDAPTLYRKILAAQPDSSVNIVSVGFSTNLARLLDTPADKISRLTGKELVARKVKLLCMMAGCFNDVNTREYNVIKDIAAAQKVFDQWPTTIVTSPFEVGIAINYPAASIENDFGWAPLHPTVEAYKSYQSMPYDRPTWDLTSVLYAVEGTSWFGVSPAGTITVTDNGKTDFTPSDEGRHYYLTVDAAQAAKIKDHFVELVTSKPKNFR
jgi:inosine-uridine nucleoside N-ribohydrolase